jgi:gamma-glutamyltranspeptidase/glutathione hydrolase
MHPKTALRGLSASLILAISCLQPATLHAQPAQTILRNESIHNLVAGLHGMVVTQNDLASEVGWSVLQRGGNAIDAAVAIGFALAVILPRAGNLGGSGFMLMHLAKEGRTVAA